MHKLLFVIALVCSFCYAPALAAQAEAGSPLLLPGDSVRVTVWNRPELSGSFQVAANGTIRHPLYSAVVVTGIPVAEAQARVTSVAARYQANPQVVMEALLRVSVGGEVRRPGLYALPAETTLSQAVALAGGITETGRTTRARLLRAGAESRIDLSSPETALTTIRSGDQIYVERRVNVFREYIAPAGGLVAALATIANLLINN